MNLRAPSYKTRGLCWQRDRGKCCNCGLDTEALVDLALRDGLRPSFIKADADPRAIATAYWLEVYTGSPWRKYSLWEGDHVIPVEEWPEDRPGLNDEGNLKTLCTKCHRVKSADHTTRRAKRRKHRKKVGPKERQLGYARVEGL